MSVFSVTYFSLFLIIAIGFLIGRIRIKGVSLDISAVIFVALLFGHFGIIIPSDFQDVGLLFFLAAVGTRAGAQLVETYMSYGFHLFYAGIIITILPMIISAFVAHYLLKINLLSLLGALTGGMTSTPGLAAIDPMTESNAPQIAYATVYPVAMVVLIIIVQILSKF